MTNEADKFWNDYQTCSRILKAFPRGITGLTPDSVKATEEWKIARRNCDLAFARLREFNVNARKQRKSL